MEKIAGVHPEKQQSGDALFQQIVRSSVAPAARGHVSEGAVVCMPVSLVAALEEMVVLEDKVLAWCKLLKLWAMLELDGSSLVPTDKMSVGDAGLSGEVWEFVPGGGGKLSFRKPFCAGSGAWIKCQTWLAAGWKRFGVSLGPVLPTRAATISCRYPQKISKASFGSGRTILPLWRIARPSTGCADLAKR